MLTFASCLNVGIVITIITLTGTTISAKIYYEGNTCPLSAGKFGVCTKLTECKSIDNALKSKRISLNSLVQCAFSSSNLVVCCPDRMPLPQTTTTKRPRGDGGFIFPGEMSRPTKNTNTNFKLDEIRTTRQPKVLINIKNITITDQLEYIDLTQLLNKRNQLLESSSPSPSQSSSSSLSSLLLSSNTSSSSSTLSDSGKLNQFDRRPTAIQMNAIIDGKSFNQAANGFANDEFTTLKYNAEDDPWFPYQFRDSNPMTTVPPARIRHEWRIRESSSRATDMPPTTSSSPDYQRNDQFASGQDLNEWTKETWDNWAKKITQNSADSTSHHQPNGNQIVGLPTTTTTTTTPRNLHHENWVWHSTKPSSINSITPPRNANPPNSASLTTSQHQKFRFNSVLTPNTATTSNTSTLSPTRTSTAPVKPANRRQLSGAQSDEGDEDVDPVSKNRGNVRKSDTACAQFTKRLSPDIDFHIIGGEPTQPGEFPHMAGIGYRTFEAEDFSWDCGGSLISPQFVLTAAHCTENPKRQPKLIRLGKRTVRSNDDDEIAVDVQIIKIILHPDYRTPLKYHDISLIQLEKSVEFSKTVAPACLYTTVADFPLGTQVVATGWGTEDVSKRTQSHFLLKANLSTVEFNSCNQSYDEYGYNRLYGNGLLRGQICAFDPEMNKDTCQGDSGGPIQIVNDTIHLSTIVGITSFGVGCASATPSVYTRVAFYLDWIESIVWP